MEWISVKDRLPDVDNNKNTFGQRVDCFVWWNGNGYIGTYVNLGDPHWCVSHISSSKSLDVTHWMPIVAPQD